MASSSIVFYKCATCKLYIPQQKACQLMPQMAGTIESDDYCAKYEDTLYTCIDCGAAMLRPLINMVGEEVQFYCPNCLIKRETQIKKTEEKKDGENNTADRQDK